MSKADQLARARGKTALASNSMSGKTDGFLVYKDENLPKINSIRRVISAPDAKLPPILNNGQVSFSSASEAHGEPRSCYNCPFFNYNRGCQLMSPEIIVKKLIWPPEATADSKQIEYWPVCSYWVYGEPNYGKPRHIASLDPDNAGLCWINAPEVGMDKSGSCCGGANGGDDCDFYMTAVPDKRRSPQGFCRVLQKDVSNMDCCASWLDDDLVSWRTAAERFKLNG
jgi:hypothetical protein